MNRVSSSSQSDFNLDDVILIVARFRGSTRSQIKDYGRSGPPTSATIYMSSHTRSVLITGCSHGGLGAELAKEFHHHGEFRVFATARNPSKMTELRSLGIETLSLDVLSESSLDSVVKGIDELTGGTLDVLVNNAGGGSSAPVADIDIAQAKKAFDLNVWSVIGVTQRFLPLLIKSGHGIIVNHTSVASVVTTPFMSCYNASKAAAAMFNNHMRVELAAFGIQVTELKTGAVSSNFYQTADGWKIPQDSIYQPIRSSVEHCMRGEPFRQMQPANEWAKEVVSDLLTDPQHVPAQIWRGVACAQIRERYLNPDPTASDADARKLAGLDELAKQLKQ